MQPLFTLHAGEYLVGAHIERRFKKTNVWVPIKDTGIDLLVSDPRNQATVSLQVKFSKDFLVTHMQPQFQERLRACGWWTINREKLGKSRADYWVFVLQGFASRSTDFVVVPRQELLGRLTAIHGAHKTIQSYIWGNKRSATALLGDSRADPRRSITCRRGPVPPSRSGAYAVAQ